MLVSSLLTFPLLVTANMHIHTTFRDLFSFSQVIPLIRYFLHFFEMQILSIPSFYEWEMQDTTVMHIKNISWSIEVVKNF